MITMKLFLINPLSKSISLLSKQEQPQFRSFQLNMFLVNHLKKPFIIIVQLMKLIQLLLGIFILTSIVNCTCSSGCVDCDQQSSICYACGEAYQLTVSGQCRKEEILPHCALFGPADACFLCAPTYILQNSACEKVYDGCLKKDGDSCLTCAFGTTLFGGNCIGAINCEVGDKVCTKCKAGFKLQSEVCVDYTGNCQIRQDNGVCRTCKDKYNLIGFQCISSQTRAYGCDIYEQDLTCLSCKGGFELYSGYCLLFWWIQDIKAKIITLDGIIERENIPRIIQHSGKDKENQEKLTTTTGVITLNSQAVVVNQGSITQETQKKEFSSPIQPFKDTIKIIPNCKLAEPNPGQRCLQCIEEYINIKNGCFPKVQWCSTYDEEIGDCLYCLYDFALQNGQCIDHNCLNSASSLCLKCKDHFSLDRNGVCQFNDPNCITFSKDKCVTCNKGFILTTQGYCFAVPKYCTLFSTSTLRCQSCQFGFYLSDSNSCQQISLQNCISADTQGNCLNCKQGFYLKDKICLKVSQFCSSYDIKTGICNECVKGWLIYDGNCYDENCMKKQSNLCLQCKDGYYLSQNKCLLMRDRNCHWANQNGVCIECKNNFDLLNGLCLIRKFIIDNCVSYSDQTGLCISCKQAFNLSQGKCIPLPTIKQINTKKDPNCIHYSDSGSCLSCSQRFYLSSKSMLCTAVNSQCNDYSLSTGECISCFVGYIIKQGQCIIVNDSKQNCKTKDTITGKCLNCYSGFYYSQLYSKCIPFNPLCRASNLTDGSCLTCFSGYSNINGVCVFSFSDPNCRQSNSTNCLVCSLGFFLDATGKCRQASPLCKIFNTTNGFCLGCYPGYSLSNGNCIVNSALTSVDPNCMNYNQNKCTKCYRGYYLNKVSVCIQANPLCKTIDSTSGFCTACYPGYIINNSQCIISDSSKDNSCKQVNSDGTCTACYKNYYLSNAKKCISADPLCKSYNELYTACTQCFAGYQVVGSHCQKSTQVMHSSSNDPNCMTAINGTCTSCALGYYLNYEFSCKLMNPICKSTDSYGNCKDCYQGYIVSNNTCIILNTPNIPYCQTFSEQTCTSCITGYYLKKGECLLISILCNSFDTNTQSCIQCRSGYILQAGQCIYPSMGPDDNCIGYTGTYCSSCKDGFFLKNFICTLIDPNCNIFDKNLGTCISCLNGLSPSGSKCI